MLKHRILIWARTTYLACIDKQSYNILEILRGDLERVLIFDQVDFNGDLFSKISAMVKITTAHQMHLVQY